MKPYVARDPDEVLRERAATLARREATEDSIATVELTTFSVGGHLFALPSAQVLRAAPLRHVTDIPGGPSYLNGVTAVDGHLVSLLDLATFLKLGRRGVGDVTACLVVAHGASEIGLSAEQLFGIEDVRIQSIAPLPDPNGPLKQVARLPGRDLLILDVESLFDDPRLGAQRHG
jgi:purine-binding chemotaxis protein CheW